ncbi:hypothetical protein BLNAU_20300 [Blattamonas nauphoetae]|uniref:Cyclin N-terminal domain-containing protein n=1 Tax=Blattamonas nauphoetae TaxID=2049346 RepID=A0ABQ9WZ90_9EUKA|nr:hypothetical protein BLNAU_20300 [Blattamonas nauphoetae]
MSVAVSHTSYPSRFSVQELRQQLSMVLSESFPLSPGHIFQKKDPSLLDGVIPFHSHTMEIDSRTNLVLDNSRSASIDEIRLIAAYLTDFLLNNVRDISLTPQDDGHKKFEALGPKIEKLFEFVARLAYFQTGELVFAGYLIVRMVEADLASGLDQADWIVSSSNIGTVLVVALMLSNKINRDIPSRSRWWADTFSIPLGLLNSSEEFFLEQLKYEVSPTDVRVACMIQKVLDALVL